MVDVELLGTDAGADGAGDRCGAGGRGLPGLVAPDAGDHSQAATGGSRRLHPLRRHVAQALPLHVRRRDLRVHGDVGERGRLAGRVPAVDVVGRVGLGVALGLGSRERGLERAALGDGLGGRRWWWR